MESRAAFAAAVTMADFFFSSLVKTVVWGARWEGQNEVYRKESDSGGIQVKPTKRVILRSIAERVDGWSRFVVCWWVNGLMGESDGPVVGG